MRDPRYLLPAAARGWSTLATGLALGATGAMPVAARQAVLPPPFLPALVAPLIPPAVTPPLAGALTGFDAPVAPSPDAALRLDAMTDTIARDTDRGMDAMLAAWILGSGLRGPSESSGNLPTSGGRPRIGLGPYLPRQPLQTTKKAQAVAQADGFSWSALTSQNMGDSRRVAMALSQSLDATTYGTTVQLHHASGPIDMKMVMTGNKTLGAGGPMALAYSGSASVDVLPVLQLGLRAKGDLGTTGDMAFSPDQSGAALARFKLGRGRTQVSAETSYNFPLTSTSDSAVPRHVQMSLNFNWKM